MMDEFTLKEVIKEVMSEQFKGNGLSKSNFANLLKMGTQITRIEIEIQNNTKILDLVREDIKDTIKLFNILAMNKIPKLAETVHIQKGMQKGKFLTLTILLSFFSGLIGCLLMFLRLMH